MPLMLPTHPAGKHVAIWQPYNRKPLTFRGLDCCLYVDRYDDGLISVVLIPEDDDMADCWPVDVLALPLAEKGEILKQLRANV